MTTQALGGPARGNAYDVAGPRKGPKVFWETSQPGVGGGKQVGSVLVTDGTVFTVGDVHRGPRPKTKEWPTQALVAALDAKSGATRWTFKVPKESGARSTLSLRDGVLYAATTLGLHALHAETGKEKWLASSPTALVSRPLVVVDDLVITPLDEGLGAFDAATGKARWKVAKSLLTWVTGTMANLDGLIFFHAEEPEKGGRRRRSVFALDVRAKKPAVVWKAATFHKEDDSPVLSGDRLIFWDEPGRGPKVHAVDARTGKSLWERSFEEGVAPGLAANGTLVVVSLSSGELAGLSAADGAVAWKSAWGGKPSFDPGRFALGRDAVFSSRSDADASVLVALDARTGKGLWKLSAPGDHASWRAWAPALGEGVLYAQTLEGVVALS